MNYEAIPDRKLVGTWRVEAIDFDNEGVGYIAIFSGPKAQERAEEYANWKNGIQQRRPALKAS